MKPDFVPEMWPMGPQLEAAARALSAARQQAPAWLAPLAEVLQRMAQAPLAQPNRFARVDATDLRGVDAPAPAQPLPGEPQHLPDGVRARLRSQVGTAADQLRVYDDEPAHRLARRHAADAVSVGADVYFAGNRYQPHDTRGFALLAHEAVHVAHATRPDAPWQRTGAAALAREEASAHAAESAALRGTAGVLLNTFAPPSLAAAPAWSVPPAVVAAPPATSAGQRPMAAAAERVLDAPASGFAMDMEAMRQTLMRDLMSQIRADMERGG